MELTPIRIRGRRKRDRPTGSDGTNASAPTSALRSRKVARFNHAGTQVLKKKPRHDAKLSVFEQLPTEIIQTIFAYCENISLPLSSFMFARQLSHERIYVRYVVDTLWKECPSCSEERADEVCDKAPTISRILQCKWMSWHIFKTAVRELQSRTAKERIVPEGERNYVVALNFDNPHEQGQLDYLHLQPSVQIPKKLLQGPWTQEKVEFLYYLIWSNVSVDWERSSRGEIATSGLQQAVEERNSKAVASLLSQPIGVVPTGSMVRSAVIDHGCDETIVFHLLNAALRAQILSRAEARMLTDFTFRDPSLWSWAGRMRNNGNRKGAWLTAALKYAGDAAARSSTYDEHLFEEFVRECGRESDGVVRIEVPLQTRHASGVAPREAPVEEG